jgi:hypothetical protein
LGFSADVNHHVRSAVLLERLFTFPLNVNAKDSTFSGLFKNANICVEYAISQPQTRLLFPAEWDGDEVQALINALPAKEPSQEVDVDLATFKVAYSDCFVNAFLADLNQVRDEDGNSTMVGYCLDSTATSIDPSHWGHFVK